MSADVVSADEHGPAEDLNTALASKLGKGGASIDGGSSTSASGSSAGGDAGSHTSVGMSTDGGSAVAVDTVAASFVAPSSIFSPMAGVGGRLVSQSRQSSFRSDGGVSLFSGASNSPADDRYGCLRFWSFLLPSWCMTSCFCRACAANKCPKPRGGSTI